MQLEQIHSPVTNKLLEDYWSERANIHSFFEYKYNVESFEKRIEYLKNRSYRSKELAQVIRSYMEQYGLSQKANHYLNELEQGAVVVVGGQQAGLLTGPLYSVHKAISVILLAEQQRKALNTPVVPMFWIAGEDHDIEEINHTYTMVNGELKKRGYSERSKLKKMASTTELNGEALEQFIVNVFKDFGETQYTEDLLKNVLRHANDSKTFTDFFTLLMNDLFEKHGLLMLDATFEPFRQYEKMYFAQLVEQNEQIAKGVFAQEQKLAQAGYPKPIEATVQNANLFYIREGERFLLERQKDFFKNSAASVKFSKEELLAIASESPQSLSNNVVTRPLMQEMALPVLAFVGGPGELAYWATLKPAFETLQLQMPIFAPRLSVTLVTRQVETLLKQKELSITDVFTNKSEQKMKEFVESLKDDRLNISIEQMKMQLQRQYEELTDYLRTENYQGEDLLEKNKNYHERQFDYLKTKLEKQNIDKHETEIRHYKTIQALLYPNNQYQERFYNPYLFLNTYGETLVDDLLELPMSISDQHHLIVL
ncbi:bacillithiol biosynthesis cysteine-adding enzyme BshC [Solibacillus sp. A46]|uniref:Putative cysteine ligase BshC n=1 Tax=Solibacillus faecavium TaxID=2762221 RepID=A0ABR8XUB5_9BACL|nr:bacillithiol biosynthesis cysteine-adding enzyme BshC [Solibacillus faecavium]MBD8035536.1 bacillithiol biosynthesis cysteine-adding enzyme BshC [Solibacillus faecavium]